MLSNVLNSGLSFSFFRSFSMFTSHLALFFFSRRCLSSRYEITIRLTAFSDSRIHHVSFCNAFVLVGFSSRILLPHAIPCRHALCPACWNLLVFVCSPVVVRSVAHYTSKSLLTAVTSHLQRYIHTRYVHTSMRPPSRLLSSLISAMLFSPSFFVSLSLLSLFGVA